MDSSRLHASVGGYTGAASPDFRHRMNSMPGNWGLRPIPKVNVNLIYNSKKSIHKSGSIHQYVRSKGSLAITLQHDHGDYKLSDCPSFSTSESSKKCEQVHLLDDPVISQTDQGYSWVVLAGVFLMQAVAVGLPFSVGVYYIELQEQFGKSRLEVAWLGSLHTGLLFGAGPLVGELVTRFGHRPVAIAGSFMASLGIGLTAIAPNLWFATLTYGVIAGFGCCMAYIPSVTIIPQYFQKYRNAAFAFASAGCGLGGLCLPPIIRFLLDKYNWFGALLLTAAASMQMFVFAALFKSNKIDASNERIVTDRTLKDSVWDVVSLFIDPYMMLFLTNNLLFNVGSLIIMIMLADYAESRHVERSHAIWLLSTVSICNTLGRFSASALGLCHCNLNWTFVYLTACGLSGLSAILIPLSSGFKLLAVCAGCYGYLFGVQLSNLAVVTCEIVPETKLDLAYGLIMLFNGMGAALGPLVGSWLCNSTNNYDSAFYVAGATIVLASLSMIPIWTKSIRKAKPNSSVESLEKLGVEG